MSDHDERNHHGQEPATRETPLWSAPPPGEAAPGGGPSGEPFGGPPPAGPPPAGPPSSGPPPAGPPLAGPPPAAGAPSGSPTEPMTGPMTGPRHLDPYATGPQPVIGPPPSGAQPPTSGVPMAPWSGQAQIPPAPPYPPGGGYLPGGGPGGGYGPPTYAGQPTWGPPGPLPGGTPARRGRRLLSLTLVLALTTLAAIGGGVIGAWLYGRGDSNGAGNAAGVTVVDAPQLDYTSLASIASEVTPSVVQIRAGDGSGSGVVMSEDGYVLTNAHVVATATNDQVSVRFSNGETAPATIVGADARSDIAVVRVDGDADLTPARFGDSDQALVGDTVLAIGSPLGFDGSVTQGIISQRDRTLPVGGGTEPRQQLSGLLQTDASINPGNSGGPLVNLAGEVVGINTAIATDGQANGFLGLGFAVPSNRATDVAQQLIDGEEVSHAFLGVSVTTVETGGALIGEIAPGSPAEQAGLREGDIVTQVNGQTIADSSDLVNVVQSAAPGDTLEIEFERDGVGQSASVTLVEVAD